MSGNCPPHTVALETAPRTQLVEQASFQNGSYIDGRGLQENILLVAAAAPALDPENGVAVLQFHQEAELHSNLLVAAGKVEDLLQLKALLQFRTQAGSALLQSQKFVAISSMNSRRFSKAKRPSPGAAAKKNRARSRTLFSAPESEADSMWLRCSEASTSRHSSSNLPLLTETPNRFPRCLPVHQLHEKSPRRLRRVRHQVVAACCLIDRSKNRWWLTMMMSPSTWPYGGRRW